MATHKALHVVVRGRVQGVGFRWECSLQARSLGVTGWVRNLPDGRVEAHFEGPASSVDRMLAWTNRGPGYASVAGVEATSAPFEGYRDFSVR